MQLEFRMQIHFATWPLTQANTGEIDVFSLSSRMKAFKHYLETKGAALAKQGEFLAYYALPYVTEPETHPSFSHLFSPELLAERRCQLEMYLLDVPCQVEVPRLYMMNHRAQSVQCVTPVINANSRNLHTSSPSSAGRSPAELFECQQVIDLPGSQDEDFKETLTMADGRRCSPVLTVDLDQCLSENLVLAPTIEPAGSEHDEAKTCNPEAILYDTLAIHSIDKLDVANPRCVFLTPFC